MNAASKLRGTGYRVERDYPMEIAEARQRLWPMLKAERSKKSYGSGDNRLPSKVREKSQCDSR